MAVKAESDIVCWHFQGKTEKRMKLKAGGLQSFFSSPNSMRGL